MAKNTGDDHRNGSVSDRTQVLNPANGKWTKRDVSGGDDAGEFMDVKQDGEPFKGVAKERDGRRS